MRCLNADSGGQRGKANIERRELHLGAAFLLPVGEGLPHAERRRVGRVGEPDFVVPVVGRSGPEPYRLDRSAIRPIFALGGELGLTPVDAGEELGSLDVGDVSYNFV